MFSETLECRQVQNVFMSKSIKKNFGIDVITRDWSEQIDDPVLVHTSVPGKSRCNGKSDEKGKPYMWLSKGRYGG